jgi:predicted DNA-binding protein
MKGVPKASKGTSRAPTKGAEMELAAAAQKGSSTRRILIEFPEELLERAQILADEQATDRSKFIRTAVEKYVRMIERQRLERELAEAYQANSELALGITREFSAVDGESF